MVKDTNNHPWYANQKTLIISVAAIILWIMVVIVFMFLNRNNAVSTGSLGDAFNGLIAPLISLFAAFLVYISFREQYKANEHQYKANKILESQWIFDTYLSLFREVEDEYNSLRLVFWDTEVHPPEKVNRNGLEGFNMITELGIGSVFLQGAVPMFENLKEPVEELIYLIKEIDKSDFSQKHFLAYKILRFYNGNLKDLAVQMQKTMLDHNTFKTEETFVSLANLRHTIEKLEKLFESPIR